MIRLKFYGLAQGSCDRSSGTRRRYQSMRVNMPLPSPPMAMNGAARRYTDVVVDNELILLNCFVYGA